MPTEEYRERLRDEAMIELGELAQKYGAGQEFTIRSYSGVSETANVADDVPCARASRPASQPQSRLRDWGWLAGGQQGDARWHVTRKGVEHANRTLGTDTPVPPDEPELPLSPRVNSVEMYDYAWREAPPTLIERAIRIRDAVNQRSSLFHEPIGLWDVFSKGLDLIESHGTTK